MGVSVGGRGVLVGSGVFVFARVGVWGGVLAPQAERTNESSKQANKTDLYGLVVILLFQNLLYFCTYSLNILLPNREI